MQQKPRVVIVAEDPELSRIASWVERSALLVCARTARNGLASIDGTEAAVVVEDAPRIGDARDFLARARGLSADAERIVLTGPGAGSERFSDDVVRWHPPIERGYVLEMLQRACLRESERAYRLERVVDRWCAFHELTRAERRILELLAQGVPRRDLAQVTRTGDATIKTHIRQILKKCQRAAMADIVVAVLRAAVVEPAEPNDASTPSLGS